MSTTNPQQLYILYAKFPTPKPLFLHQTDAHSLSCERAALTQATAVCRPVPPSAAAPAAALRESQLSAQQCRCSVVHVSTGVISGGGRSGPPAGRDGQWSFFDIITGRMAPPPLPRRGSAQLALRLLAALLAFAAPRAAHSAAQLRVVDLTEPAPPARGQKATTVRRAETSAPPERTRVPDCLPLLPAHRRPTPTNTASNKRTFAAAAAALPAVRARRAHLGES